MITDIIEDNRHLQHLKTGITSDKLNQITNLETKINDLKEENKKRGRGFLPPDLPTIPF